MAEAKPARIEIEMKSTSLVIVRKQVSDFEYTISETNKLGEDQMDDLEIYQCKCEICQMEETHPVKTLHHRMNVLLSRLDEHQRRWYAALEAEKIGHGGTKQIAMITGINVNTIRRGRRELEDDLGGRPAERIRLPGGGRKPVEKKSQPSSQPSKKK